MMNELLMNGVELMLVGMGIVFLFLAMLIVAVNVMSALVQRFLPAPAPASTPVAMTAKTGVTDQSIVAAISSAVHQYRSKHK
ncbi:MAG: OadG family protein [Gammaproteobacteria bacterium]